MRQIIKRILTWLMEMIRQNARPKNVTASRENFTALEKNFTASRENVTASRKNVTTLYSLISFPDILRHTDIF